jgi:uncharacterized Zn finger protein
MLILDMTESLTQKALRLVNDGHVEIVSEKKNYVHAHVIGDHNDYEVMIWYDEEGRARKAKCGCAWNVLHQSDQHWCSHIRSVLVFQEMKRTIPKNITDERTINRD